jgi:hypothetical protein
VRKNLGAVKAGGNLPTPRRSCKFEVFIIEAFEFVSNFEFRISNFRRRRRRLHIRVLHAAPQHLAQFAE